MAELNLGRKHVCPECGKKFYDLGRAQVICPSCGYQLDEGQADVAPNRKFVREVEPAEKPEAKPDAGGDEDGDDLDEDDELEELADLDDEDEDDEDDL